MEMKEGNEIKERRADSLEGRFVLPETKPDRGKAGPAAVEFDDWVVDFSGYELPDSVVDGKNGDRAPVAAESKPLEIVDGTLWKIPGKRRILLYLLLIFVVACFGCVWCAFFDTYTAETKLLFISPVAATPRQGPWNVEQELELLKSSVLAHRVLAAGNVQEAGSPKVRQISNPATVPTNAVTKRAVGNADELLGRLSFDMARWDGGGCVTISVRGDDPGFLKSILNSYTRQYIQSRHELVNLAAIAAGPTRPGARLSGNQDFVSVLDGELARMELMKRNCELALTLMDKRAGKKKGTSSGFLPSGFGSELTSLNKINDELVNLFIKRQHLATRYNPASREISEVNQEIEGLRKMLRVHLHQQVTFLKNGMEQLQARKQEIQGQTKPAAGNSTLRERKLLCGYGPALGEWIPVSSDVVIMPGRPIVVKRPIRERIMSFLDRSLHSLFRRNNPSPKDGPNGAASRLACTTTFLERPRNGQQGPWKIQPEMRSQNSLAKHDLSAGAYK